MPLSSRVPFPICEEEQRAAQLPAGHFLSQTFSEPSWPDAPHARILATVKPDASTISADFDVSTQTGFLPPEPPIIRLSTSLVHTSVGSSPSGGWEELEEVLEAGQSEVIKLSGGGVGRVSESWRQRVRDLGNPSTDLLTTLPILRRAHVLLSFVGHLYIHSAFPSLSVVPASIAVAWVEVSDRLGLPPILTYADTVLWNWKLIDPSLGVTPQNVSINTTFTLDASETAFFLLSLLSELYGPPALRLMSATLDESFFVDSLRLSEIAAHLESIGTIVNELTALLSSAMKGSFGVDGKEKIVPEIFYWEIRPWFNGGTWKYEGVAGESMMEWGGPSAGQSSLIHALDLFLGIDHSPRPSSSSSQGPSRPPMTRAATSTASMDPMSSVRPIQQAKPTGPASDSTFMLRASQYMPLYHRAFLLHLSALSTLSIDNLRPLPSIRSLASKNPAVLGPSFDKAVGSMKKFRDEHMKIATRFIVSQARREPSTSSVFWEEWNKKWLQKEAAATTHKGTGGTELVAFLKGCRERTVEALVLP